MKTNILNFNLIIDFGPKREFTFIGLEEENNDDDEDG